MEAQQVKSMAGDFESGGILDRTILAVKEIVSARNESEKVFFGGHFVPPDRPRVPKNAGNYREDRRSRSMEPMTSES